MPRGVSRYDEAQLQGRLWTPAAIRSSLVGWWDASNLPSLTLVSGAASQLDDLSGFGRHLTQGTAGSRPVWTTNDCLAFDGSGDEMATGSAWSATTEGEIFIAGVWTDSIGSGTRGTVGMNGRNLSGMIASAGTTTAHFDWNGNSGSNRVTASGTFPVNQRDVWSFTNSVARGLQRIRWNGTTVGSDANGQSPSISGVIYWGSYWSSSFSHGGHLCEWLVSRDVSDITAMRVEGYLAHKWGFRVRNLLTASHPYRNAPPLIGG